MLSSRRRRSQASSAAAARPPPVASAKPSGGERSAQAPAVAPRRGCSPSAQACAWRHPEPMPPAEPIGRDQFAGASGERLQDRARNAGLDLLHRRRHGLLLVRARVAQSQRAAAAGRGADRGADQLFPLRLSRRRRRPTEPFRTTVAVFPSPWSEGRKIIRIGIKGYAVQAATRPRANLVFLIDTSGSMNAPNRLPLVKQSLAMLLAQLEAERPRGDRHLCGQRRHRARADRGIRQGEDPRRARAARSRRQHGGRRGHPAGLCAGRAEFRRQRRQPRDPGNRRRLQRRHHQPRRAQGLRRAPARQRASSSPSSASAWATTTTR